MHRTAFASGYTGMTASGADWVVANLPAIRLVGIDYTSIAVFEDVSGPHVPLLSKVRPSAARKLTLLASLLQAEQAHLARLGACRPVTSNKGWPICTC